MPRVSVVVPTCNRPVLLARCLEALLKQDLPPADYEIIIVDDANSAETCKMVEQRAEQASPGGHCILYLPAKYTHGPAAARNIGLRAARSEIIAFTDDDCIPSPGWLSAGLAAMADGVAGVAGRVSVPLNGVPTDYEYNASHMAQCDFVTANCFYRRDALLLVEGFDERFTMAWREDTDLIYTLRERGLQFACAPDALVIHPVRAARWGISISQQRKSIFNALLYKKHPVLYRQLVQPAPPWHYYGIVGALLLALAGVIAMSGLVALIGLALWGCQTGLFCMKRLRHTSHSPRHVAEMIVTSLVIPPLAIYWRLRGAIKYRVFFL
jgi:GT2 family glycosyltransferase